MALATAHAGGLAYNARLYGLPSAVTVAIVVHVSRVALLVAALVALALRGGPALGIAAVAFAATHGPVVALLARRR
jgi:hypothetical protein